MAQVPSLKYKNAELTTTSMIDLLTYMVLGNLVEAMLLHDSFGFCISPKKNISIITRHLSVHQILVVQYSKSILVICIYITSLLLVGKSDDGIQHL